jgi:hypothetical protein
MLPAIDLDDQPLLATDEIDDVRSEALLADEFRAAELPRAQAGP